jgi:arginyl-tRNA--protein-N-Asp/Glu arginylyltransferase
VSAPFRFPRFFVTSPSPCPYLPGRQERKVFTELTGQHASELNDALGRIGFRRSQSVAYRPSCVGCSACVSVRVVSDGFKPNATQRKLLKRHSDLQVHACRPWATEEQFALLRRYLSARHPGGGMANMDAEDYADMVEQSPVNSVVVEYREPDVDGQRGRLVGACITDQQADGLSMIYSYFLADDPTREGLGNYIIMDHILRSRASGLDYVYLGYWVKGSQRMAYKTRYRPIEVLGPDGWAEFDPDADAVPAHAPRVRELA